MYYSYHKRYFKDRVLVHIEEFNKKDGTVLFDFIDSNEYELFANFLNISYNLDKPSMVFLTNYRGRTIRENTVYSLTHETIISWQKSFENDNSFLIGFNIELENNNQNIFNDSVSLNDFSDRFYINDYMIGGGNNLKISFQSLGKTSVTIRSVGQGNWNEVSFDNSIKIVFDAGAPMNASRAQIVQIIANRNTLYSASKPTLILSHWDKDHYHSLLGMSDNDLQNNFSSFICRDRVPNVTSRKLFNKLKCSIGYSNIYCIPANLRTSRGGPTFFTPIPATPITNKIVLYNSQQHKNRNISGLMLTIKTSNNSIILSGDAHYEQISRDILPDLNFTHKHNLVVPHHGGSAGTYIYNTSKLITLDKAIISVGVNRYGHPVANNVSSLQTSKFQIQRTDKISNDITIPL